MENFGERLKFLRGDVSQAELARELGIRQTTLSNYERCRNEPTYETLKKICSHFGVNSAWVMYGSGPMRPDAAEEEASSADLPTSAAGCARCVKLEEKLERVERQRDDLTDELRQLWKENACLRERVARLEGQVDKADLGRVSSCGSSVA